MSASFVSAQQLPQYSLYLNNDFVLNPAIAGTKSYNPLYLHIRNQWAGFSKAPKTQLITYHSPFNKKVGLGGILFNDNTGGAIKRTGAQLNYAYRVPMSNDFTLSMGLSAGLYQYIFDQDRVELHDDEPDEAMKGGMEKILVHDANFGLYLYKDEFYFGASVPHLIQSKINLESLNDENKLVRHYFITSGYRFNEVKPNIDIEPSILLKGIGAAPMQLDVNIRAHYKNFLWGGLSFRSKDAVVVMLGGDYNNYLFGYSYDIAISDIASHSVGSHGIMVGYKFGKAGKDSDNDGLTDDVDLCPNEWGEKKTGGCPDSDEDGIIDKFDKCPDIKGTHRLYGCPFEMTDEMKKIVNEILSKQIFYGNSEQLVNGIKPALAEFAQKLKDNPTWDVIFDGAIGQMNDEEEDFNLSIDRAMGLKNHLESLGVNQARIKLGYSSELLRKGTIYIYEE